MSNIDDFGYWFEVKMTRFNIHKLNLLDQHMKTCNISMVKRLKETNNHFSCIEFENDQYLRFGFECWNLLLQEGQKLKDLPEFK